MGESLNRWQALRAPKILVSLRVATLRFDFKNQRLKALYTSEKDAHKYPPGVVDAFFEVMSAIDAARDERDLYVLKGLRYEKLKGRRAEQRSVRLNDQWRLVIEIEEDAEGRWLLIVSLEDYH